MEHAFLRELAEKVFQQNQSGMSPDWKPDLHGITVVFPNRRAGLFFQKYLSGLIKKPIWAPEVTTLEDFTMEMSTLQLADPLTLIFELYHAFNEYQQVPEPFERFYFWGEMLVKDFEELDRYLVDPEKLFISVKNQKELDEAFYFLDEKDKKTIQLFWASFLPDASPSQYTFLKTWEILLPVYKRFIQKLQEKGLAYTGLIYRNVANELTESLAGADKSRKIIFAGFNALTRSEEMIIKHFVDNHDAEIYWDYDDYYFNDEKQEAGVFLRDYARDSILKKTFPEEAPKYFEGISKEVSVTGVSLEVGQAKAIGEYLQQLIKAKKFDLEETVVVLPKEHMLFPLLNSLPNQIDKLNVTMGYPLKETPLFSLLESVLQLQATARLEQDFFESFYYQPVTEIFSHPYVAQAFPEETEAYLQEIRKVNKIMIAKEELHGKVALFEIIFQLKNNNLALCDYMVTILKTLYAGMEEVLGLEREYLFQFYQIFERLKEILSMQSSLVEINTFIKLFRQVTRTVKIPFRGEPLEGLQIMGVLETRNLDFKHVILLSMNEGNLPADSKGGSFIPYNIRKAFGLPTFEQQDAIYSYLFYRLIQRAESIQMYYNTSSEFGLKGEVSRYIRQLKQESGLEVKEKVLANKAELSEAKPIEIAKDERVQRTLSGYLAGGRSRFSPSALNTYLDCKLRFYFRYVAKLYTHDEVSEEMDAAMFGNILHRAMEILYENLTKKRKPAIVQPADFFTLRSSVDGAITLAFRDYYHLPKSRKLILEGRNLVMYEVMKDFIGKVIDHDESYAPFEIIALEGGSRQGYKLDYALNDGRKVGLKGIIDRIDRKNGKVRVIDYKSGKDDRNIGSREAFFDRDSYKRNKAAMQTFYYAMLYINKHGDGEPIKPGIFNMRELFQDNFDESLMDGDEPLLDIRQYMEEFKADLGALLEEIFDPNDPFTQTEDPDKCRWCDYNGICRRK
ncbi:MAG: PD-(D/E)XK nuclease family protein [Bacteroidota bacterium]